MKRVFVFDLGNVIVKPMNIKMLYEMLNCKISYENFSNFFKSSKYADEVHMGRISDEQYIKEVLKYANSDKTIEEFKEIYTGPIRNELYINTISIIETLKKRNEKVCMLSNLRKIDFEWFSTKYDVKIFDELFLSYEMHLLKPDEEIYMKMLNKLNTIPEIIYFFDDNENNINAAKKLNINAYLTTGETIKDIFEKELLI